MDETGFDPSDIEKVMEFLNRITQAITMTDPDDRLDYLQSVNPGLTEEHLGEIAKTTERWLEGQAGQRIRNTARATYESKSAQAVWIGTQPRRRLKS